MPPARSEWDPAERFIKLAQIFHPGARIVIDENEDWDGSIDLTADVFGPDQKWPLRSQLTCSFEVETGLPDLMRTIRLPAGYVQPKKALADISTVRGVAAGAAAELNGWWEMEARMSDKPVFSIVLPKDATEADRRRVEARQAILVYQGTVSRLDSWSESMQNYTTAVEVLVEAETGRLLWARDGGRPGSPVSGRRDSGDVLAKGSWVPSGRSKGGSLRRVEEPAPQGGRSVTLASGTVLVRGMWHSKEGVFVHGQTGSVWKPDTSLKDALNRA